MTYALIAIVLVVVYLATRRSKTTKPSWRFDPWTTGIRLDDGPSFYFSPSKDVGYLQNTDPPKLTYGKTLTARFKIEGGPFTAKEFPERTSIVGLVIQRKGDNWSAEGEYASYRWYSSQTVPLEAGEFTLSVPLDILDWGPVQGTKSLHLFNQALKHVESIGFTFGSAGGRGHGVHGSGRFTLLWMGVS